MKKGFVAPAATAVLLLTLPATGSATGSDPAAAAGAKTAASARTAAPSGWFPLAAGLEWTYQIKGESVVSVSGQKPVPRPVEVTEIEQMSREDRRFRIDTRIEPKGRSVSTRTLFITADDKGVYLAGQVLEAEPPAKPEPVDYTPALVLLRLPLKRGDTWPVGIHRHHAVRMDQKAEVLGFEDVTTPAGTFRRCLKLRYTAGVSGSVTVDGKSVPIDNGDVQTVEWYAAAVGNVKQVSTYSQSYTTPAGKPVTVVDRRTRVLVSWSGGKPGK